MSCWLVCSTIQVRRAIEMRAREANVLTHYWHTPSTQRHCFANERHEQDLDVRPRLRTDATVQHIAMRWLAATSDMGRRISRGVSSTTCTPPRLRTRGTEHHMELRRPAAQAQPHGVMLSLLSLGPLTLLVPGVRLAVDVVDLAAAHNVAVFAALPY